MNTRKRTPRTCSRCGRTVPISSGLSLCEVCLYHDEVGADAAERQLALANAVRDREYAARKARRS